MFVIYSLVALVCLAGCGPSSTSEISQKIAKQFQASGRTEVDLSQVMVKEWDRVCIFGPHSNNRAAKSILTFDWDIEGTTSIASNRKIALLLFVQDKHVIESVEHPRDDGDFTNLSRQCIVREKATFAFQANPTKGWPGLFPKS